MIYCRACAYLRNNDPDGMVFTCKLTKQKCFINDLPMTQMSKCPLENANRCVCCDAVIPEGGQVCRNCEAGARITELLKN